jgi:hypothetical protein
MKDVQYYLDQIIALTGDKNLRVEYNSVYGGYRVYTLNKSTSHSGALGESSTCARRKKSDMIEFLNGIIYGLQYDLMKK